MTNAKVYATVINQCWEQCKCGIQIAGENIINEDTSGNLECSESVRKSMMDSQLVYAREHGVFKPASHLNCTCDVGNSCGTNLAAVIDQKRYRP